MQVSLTEVEVQAIYGRLDEILQVLSAAEGREASYAARRDTFKVIQFCGGSGDNHKQSSLIEEVKAMLISLNLKGTVRERRNGLLEFRSAQLGSVYGRSEEEIREKIEKKLRQLKSHQPPKKKKSKAPLLSEFFEKKYLPYKRAQQVAERTIKGYIYNLSFIVQSGFDKRLDSYTPAMVEEFLYSVPQTRKRQILQGLLNNIFKRAYALSLIKANPCDPLDHVAHEQEIGKAFSFKEMKEFFSALFASKLTTEKKLFLVFVFLTGARRCEALGVRVCDVNFEEKILHIPGTKTDLSDRDIPLSPLVEELLGKFQLSEGRYFAYSEYWAQMTFHVVKTDHKLHDLRHTFGTLKVCCDKMDPKTAAIFLGHSNIVTTLKYYTHPEALDKGLFLRGDLSEDQKTEVLRAKQAEIYGMIRDYLDSVPKFVPKKSR